MRTRRSMFGFVSARYVCVMSMAAARYLWENAAMSGMAIRYLRFCAIGSTSPTAR